MLKIAVTRNFKIEINIFTLNGHFCSQDSGHFCSQDSLSPSQYYWHISMIAMVQVPASYMQQLKVEHDLLQWKS